MKATEILGEIKDKTAVNQLIKNLQTDSEANVREWSAIALGNIKDKKALKPLMKSLKSDDDWEVRMEAANALGKIKSKEAIDSLMHAYYYDPNYKVNWSAAAAISMIDKNNAKELVESLSANLIKILKEEKDEDMLSAAAKTLGEIGNKLAAKAMLAKRNVNKEMVKLEIDLALGKMAERFEFKTKEEFIHAISARNFE